MANRYLSEDGIAGPGEKSSAPESLYVDLQGDQRTRPIMCATEFSNTGIHKKKSTSFQITSVTVQGSRLSNDGGEDSADDLDESHTEDISSDILDCSKTTDLDNDPLSSDNSNANLDDLGVPVASKQNIPVKVLTNDPDTFGASHSVGVNPGLSVDNTVTDTDITLMANTTTALPVITTQVPIVNSLPEHLQHRFKVVKIVSTEPFKRGRWLCMDFTDPPAIHGEHKVETSETTDTTTHVSSSFNVVPSDNPQSVAQFYEFPVNQTSISSVPQQQQTSQSVYGILLPVANNPGPVVTKVQNVGVQATPTHQVESVSHQAVAVQVQPVTTQSQATQATVSAPSVSLPQSQMVQVTPNSAQNQTVLPTTQGVYPPASQVSQPNTLIPTTQGMPSTQQQQVISAPQASQVLPVMPHTQAASRSQPSQPMPLIQPAPVIPISQPSQVMTGAQQTTTMAAPTQQSHIQTSIPPNPILTSSLAGQGISVPPGHVIANAQASQGMPVPQATQGLPITQPNPGLPTSQGLSLPVGQQVMPSVQQLIPMSQPSHMIPMSQPIQSVAGLPVQGQTTMLTSAQGPQDHPAPQATMGVAAPAQPNASIPVTQASQALPKLKATTSLPLQPTHGLPVSQTTPQVISGAQTNPCLTSQPITVNQPIGLPVTQSVTSLPATQPSAQPVLVADTHPPGSGGTSVSAKPLLTSDLLASSQSANKTSPPLQGAVKESQLPTTSVANVSPLVDILPDALGTKTLPEGEENESASSGTNTVAIDNKIEQAMDLVKSHLMFAVREEVDVLKEKITELMDRISQLEHENGILKANATPEMLNQLNSEQGACSGVPASNMQQPPAATHEHP